MVTNEELHKYVCSQVTPSLVVLAVHPARLAPLGPDDLVRPLDVLVEAVVRGEAGRADGAGEGPLPAVLPLVRLQRLLRLEHLFAHAAAEPGRLVAHHVLLQGARAVRLVTANVAPESEN